MSKLTRKSTKMSGQQWSQVEAQLIEDWKDFLLIGRRQVENDSVNAALGIGFQSGSVGLGGPKW